MKVLVVAPYISADGGYGGPVAVALDHARALVEAGHEVTLVAGWDGVVTPSTPARLRLFRARRPLRRSFVGLIAPGLIAWVAGHAADADVVHVHLTRDLVTLPAAALALWRGSPVVVQTHGQIRPQRSLGQAVLDVVLTRPVFSRAGAFLVLTSHEEADLRALAVPAAALRPIDNGVPVAVRRAEPPGDDPLVLFSSRLAARKRPRAFVAAAEIVHRHRPDVRFELWGPDGGEEQAVQEEITRRGLSGVCGLRGAVGVEDARMNLARAAVFVLPSRAEPFPMALLEAFSASLPAVVTADTGLSQAALDAGAAEVTDGSPEGLAAGIMALLDDPAHWAAVSAAASGLAAGRFAMHRIAARLTDVYEEVSCT